MPKFQADEIVYRPFAPLEYGRVLEVLGDDEFLVRWKSGSESSEMGYRLKSLEKLQADHEKKAATHRANILKAKQL